MTLRATAECPQSALTRIGRSLHLGARNGLTAKQSRQAVPVVAVTPEQGADAYGISLVDAEMDANGQAPAAC